MRIIIHLRSDAAAKAGGDVTLGKQYKALLEQAGHQVDLTTSFDFQGSYDLGLTFNFDRPFEGAQFVKFCKAQGIPTMMYALHHPSEGVGRYLESGTSGARRLFALLSFGAPRWYETWLVVAKALTGKQRIGRLSNLPLLHVSTAQRYIAERVERLLVSTPMEGDVLHREFLVPPAKIAIVPHILHTVPAAECRTVLVRDIDVICAGRIESRKNQLLVAKLAGLMPSAKFLFVGTPSSTEGGYFSQFQEEIKNLGNCEYLPSLPMDQLREQMRRSRVFISLSWFEVVSLTEMEALACGCHLVVGKYSYSKSIAEEHGDFVEPDDIAGIQVLLARLLTSPYTNAQAFDLNKLLDMTPDSVSGSFASAFQSAGLQ